MIELDGRRGEGGGQVLRAALTLSMVTGRPFRITGVRAGRSRPGLRRQHRTAVRGAAELVAADVEGNRLGSTELRFGPGREVRPGGDHRFDTGGAGSACLVLQTLLPALLTADGPSRVAVDGGTHNPAAPPFEFLDRAWAPLLRETGADFELGLDRVGFHPGGGGRVWAEVSPGSAPRPLRLEERGDLRGVRARAHVADLPDHVAERELATAAAALEIPDDRLELVRHERPGGGAANVLVVEVESAAVTEVFTEHGRKGLPAEEVARRAARRVREYLESGVPVWTNLADQLPVPLALGAGGRYRTGEPSSHARTVGEVVAAFVGTGPTAERVAPGEWLVEVSPGDAE